MGYLLVLGINTWKWGSWYVARRFLCFCFEWHNYKTTKCKEQFFIIGLIIILKIKVCHQSFKNILDYAKYGLHAPFYYPKVSPLCHCRYFRILIHFTNTQNIQFYIFIGRGNKFNFHFLCFQISNKKYCRWIKIYSKLMQMRSSSNQFYSIIIL